MRVGDNGRPAAENWGKWMRKSAPTPRYPANDYLRAFSFILKMQINKYNVGEWRVEFPRGKVYRGISPAAENSFRNTNLINRLLNISYLTTAAALAKLGIIFTYFRYEQFTLYCKNMDELISLMPNVIHQVQVYYYC